MKKNIDFTQFFISPDAWDAVTEIDSKDPIDEFNKFNKKIQFDKSLNLSSLNQFFHELILYIKMENIHYVNNLVFGFIPILLNITDKDNKINTDCAFYQISKQMFYNIYKRNQKYSSVLIAVSLFDILSSNLPISISYGHLFHIQENQAKLIHKYLYEGNTFSLPTKCLAATLAFPSSRFNVTSPDYESFCTDVANFDPIRSKYLPDPKVILEKYIFFTPAELIYASFSVQYSNSLVFAIGFDQLNSQNNGSLTLYRCSAFQDLIIHSELTLGSLCHAIHIHSTQPDTIVILNHFFTALDCSCGFELLKELFTLNTTLSFRYLVKDIGVIALLNVFKHYEENSNFLRKKSDNFLNLIRPFHDRIEVLHDVISALVEMTRIDEDRQKVLPFLGSLHSLLVRLTVTDLSSTYKVIIEHLIGATFVVHAFFEMLTLQPMLDNFNVTRLILCNAVLLYGCVRRFGVKSLSLRFLHGTFECVNYIMHIPVDATPFLLFEAESAMDEIREFARSHEAAVARFMVSAMPDLLLPAASSIIACFTSANIVSPCVMLKVVSYAVRSYLPHVFYAAVSAVCTFVRGRGSNVGTFLKMLFDLYLSIISPSHLHNSKSEGDESNFAFNPDKLGPQPESDADDTAHTQTLYLLILAEVLKTGSAAVQSLIRHPAFKQIYADCQFQFSASQAPYTTALCPFVEIMNALWRDKGKEFDKGSLTVLVGGEPETVLVVGDDEESDHIEKLSERSINLPSLSDLLVNVQFLWAPTAACVLKLALEVAKRLKSFPYALHSQHVYDSPADNSLAFLRELASIAPESVQPFEERPRASKTQPDVWMLPWAADCNFPWLWRYDYDFIVQQKPVVVFKRNTVLPNSQIIEEGENEEEEEEEDNDDDDSEF